MDPDERVEVSVVVRPRRPLPEVEPGAEPLSREAFAEAYGADPQDLRTVEEWARQHHLSLIESSPARRTVLLAGRAADISAALGVPLRREGDYRIADSQPTLPPELQDIVQGVFGLDTRPVARRG